MNVWPNEADHPGFKEYCETYYHDMCNITTALLKGFSLALGKEEGFFETHFKKYDTLSSVVLIRYPYIADYPPVLIAEDGTELG